MQTATQTNPYVAVAALLDLDRRAARVMQRAAARARTQSRTIARREKSARQFLEIAFA